MPDLSTAKTAPKVDFYQVKNGAVVNLDVVVGKGQPGAVAVMLAGKILANAPTVKGLVVGKGEDLRGKALLVNATVIDNNPATDETACTLSFSGGLAPRSILSTGTASSGQALVHVFMVNFL